MLIVGIDDENLEEVADHVKEQRARYRVLAASQAAFGLVGDGNVKNESQRNQLSRDNNDNVREETTADKRESKLVTASSNCSIYGTAEDSLLGSDSCSTVDQISSISCTESLCNLLDSAQSGVNSNHSASSISSSCNLESSSSGESVSELETDVTEQPTSKSTSVNRQTWFPVTAADRKSRTLPIFKKDGRTWLHKSSAVVKYGVKNVIAGRFKKDARTWLHKSSRRRRMFTIAENVLYEIQEHSDAPSAQAADVKSVLPFITPLAQLPAAMSRCQQRDIAAGDNQAGTNYIHRKPVDARTNFLSPRTRWSHVSLKQSENPY